MGFSSVVKERQKLYETVPKLCCASPFHRLFGPKRGLSGHGAEAGVKARFPAWLKGIMPF
jgi:hypothetical protein